MTDLTKQFRDRDLIPAENIGSERLARSDMTIAELMEPGWLPARAGLCVGKVVFVWGTDGMALAWVSVIDPLGVPTLSFVQAIDEAAVPAPTQAPAPRRAA